MLFTGHCNPKRQQENCQTELSDKSFDFIGDWYVWLWQDAEEKITSSRFSYADKSGYIREI
jgi:hypothetical protein